MPGDDGWDYRGKEKGGSLEDVDAYRASGGSVVQQFPAQSGSDSPSSFRLPPIDEEAASFIGKKPMEESVSAFPPPPPLPSHLPETVPPKEKGHRMATLPSSRTQLHPSRLLAGFRLPTMAHLRRKLAGLSSARCLSGVSHISLLRRLFRCFWDHILSCASGKPPSYRRLNTTSASPIELPAADDDGGCREEAPLAETAILAPTSTATESDADPDKVVLKVSLLGDCRIGKTSFVVKYVGEGEQGTFSQTAGLNLVDKILLVKEAKIAFRIWDVGGDSQYVDHVGMACKDAAAILIMFDLTNRCTLNSVIGWYRQARRWNRAAIRVLIGTKFDDFVHLPLDVQWTIVNQARSYAHAMKASLFFSSATHNINVNKIFKFITAKFFNLPWTIERNLTLGEPIIDFS